jgi:hypothetical protein
MKTINKGKLNLNRETLVELDPQWLHNARGGVGGDGYGFDGGQGGGAGDASARFQSIVSYCPIYEGGKCEK